MEVMVILLNLTFLLLMVLTHQDIIIVSMVVIRHLLSGMVLMLLVETCIYVVKIIHHLELVVITFG